ncbi:glycosyltransferase [Urbifossiella limnaea]|uniref:Undecaprenyl-phosphate mannosyltransferase n=1 Tax=Urbifossiella limnaea TaxID=2528023 RepID=A0A517XU79_9BACT|nr:glycosyltransferase [Urbifossiella limnaea]QDU21063.1 Undecaprenyl-phosphate mannosyltransferase [Urbifossiella limnaea]
MPPPTAVDPLSLVVPVYNEAANFPNLLREVEAHVPQPFTLTVVYDFDADTTVPVAREFAQTRPWLRLVKNRHKGVVGALRTGFEVVARGPVLVVMADLSDDLRDVPRMLDLYRGGASVVCPSRYCPGGKQLGGPWLKRTMSRAAGLSLHLLVNFPTRDATNNFRLYDAALVNDLGVESVGGFELALELTAKAFRRGARIAELPTTWRDRVAGESRFNLKKWLPKYGYWYGYALLAGAERALGLLPGVGVGPVSSRP